MIELQHVIKRFEGQAKPVLQDINLKINKGEFCILTGPSGAGKTTLLRLLFCAQWPTYGKIFIRGKNIANMSRREVPYLRRNLGVVFQDFKLLKERTVIENVALSLQVQGRAMSEIKKRSINVLRQVGLGARLYHYCAQLSGGEQQRVAIARALVTQPSLLICDEPTGNLDPKRSEEIMALLVEANAKGATVIVATHDPMMLQYHRSRIIRLQDGQLVESPSQYASNFENA